MELDGGDLDLEDTSDSQGFSDQDEDADAPQPSASIANQQKSSTPRLPQFDPAEALIAQQTGRKRITENRTDDEAEQWRDGYKMGIVTFQQLRRAGYHFQAPFSSSYPYGGILDAVGPDLLHQLTKCFMDYLFIAGSIPSPFRTRESTFVKSSSMSILKSMHDLLWYLGGQGCDGFERELFPKLILGHAMR
jgi:hypothetical protein